ncbi:hypothetical protein [Thalassomonas actiniarum]|uniref:Uncharacterized protein n=1 Tax=Thalassomonas actiniarum TaxID=485447 RepID=A0AAE9YP51_9GAMM|nr:hypothetical protein [Thalassomonas actiniarum]WDD97037.1 hypothetical protein SG35_016930 [Thalassomonas actiniarum]
MKFNPMKANKIKLMPSKRPGNTWQFTAFFCTLVLLGGCQLTAPSPATGAKNIHNQASLSPANFSQYYLSLKQLNPAELLDEIERVSQAKKQRENQAQKAQDFKDDIYLLLLKALPSSPIYNPYNAKDQLNQLPKEVLSLSYLKAEDLALLSLLKDQLNEQLYAQARITALEQEKGLSQQKFNRQLGGLQSSLTELQQKLTQLKNIETAIDKHGQ